MLQRVLDSTSETEGEKETDKDINHLDKVKQRIKLITAIIAFFSYFRNLRYTPTA